MATKPPRFHKRWWKVRESFPKIDLIQVARHYRKIRPDGGWVHGGAFFFGNFFSKETLREKGMMCLICFAVKLRLNHQLSRESECINTKTNSKSPWKSGHTERKWIIFQPLIFRGKLAVSFREGILISWLSEPLQVAFLVNFAFCRQKTHHPPRSWQRGFSKHCRNGGCWNVDVSNRR